MHLTGREVKQSHRKLEANADSNGASFHTVLLQTYVDCFSKVYGSLHTTFSCCDREEYNFTKKKNKDVQSKYKRDRT